MKSLTASTLTARSTAAILVTVLSKPDFAMPHPVVFRSSWLAHAVLRLLGWRVYFQGFPTLQGIAVVYPHTSNWDAPIMFLAKWACGVQVMFWGKDTLFRIPLLGTWLRWIGGVPVRRTSKEGVVNQAVAAMAQHQAVGQYFWIALAPEGTRKYLPGWRSGFYQTALRTQVPLCLVKLDYAQRKVSIQDFMWLSGNAAQDMAHIAAVYQGVQGLVPAKMAPITLLDASVPRENTIVR
jgi:1-acyl-sn-glycerol-3-phosphate acyltransferase